MTSFGNIGPFRGAGTPRSSAVGSVYTDRECVVFGETTLALRAWMREHGVARANDEKTPEDHIGLMLALMSHLCRTQPESLDDYLCGHLLTWAPHYLEGASHL